MSKVWRERTFFYAQKLEAPCVLEAMTLLLLLLMLFILAVDKIVAP